MFCIAAFIVFAILALFSASYRPLAAKAWRCVLRRVTFRPCDINFSEELKGKLLGKLIFTHPRLARFLNRWIDWLAFVFVILSIWSLFYVANAGLNLWVYDTCDPRDVESCSLGGEACGVGQEKLGLVQSIQDGRLDEWVTGPFTRFAETVSRLPDRLKQWEPSAYLSPSASYYRALDEEKPYVIEIIDPGCQFCKKLTKNLKEASVMEARNVSYLLYPIPKPEGGYKFPHSYFIASYLEAVKHVPLGSNPPADLQLLEKIFADPAGLDEIDIQTKINIGMLREDVEKQLREWLAEIGYTAAQIRQIETAATSEEVRLSLEAQKFIVESRIRTIKIPTLLIDSRRHDRVVDMETLREHLE